MLKKYWITEHNVFLCFVFILIEICVSHLTNCRIRFLKNELFYLFRLHLLKKLCKFGGYGVENNKKNYWINFRELKSD